MLPEFQMNFVSRTSGVVGGRPWSGMLTFSLTGVWEALFLDWNEPASEASHTAEQVAQSMGRRTHKGSDANHTGKPARLPQSGNMARRSSHLITALLYGTRAL